jgi:ligand-binding sensor domain-containing protein
MLLPTYTGIYPVTAIAADPAGGGFYVATTEGGITKVFGTAAPFATQQGNITSLAADAQALYWTTGDGNVLRLEQKSAMQPPTVLAKGQGNPRGLTLDRSNVIWANYSEGTIRMMPAAGGDMALVAKGQSGPWAIAATPDAIYWTNADDGTVMALER